MAEQVVARIAGSTLVQVKSVTTNGEVAAVGSVDVQPLVKMQDSMGVVQSHGIIHSIPYFRLQGGSGKAIIMDPKVGDIGVAVFANRDISSVKANKKESPPGSHRKNDMADGMYFGSFLGEKPTCYIRFTDDDKIISSPDDGHTLITLEKDKITLDASGMLVRVVHLPVPRVDLGGLDGEAVMTAGGLSTKVFAII